MRVKKDALPDATQQTVSSTPPLTSASSGPYPNMGYTTTTAAGPPGAYPPNYPNLMDLLDSPEGEDYDSPIQMGIENEEDFLDMLADADIDWSGAYPAQPGYPNQYQYQYPPYQAYGNQYNYGQFPPQTSSKPKTAPSTSQQSSSEEQDKMDTGEDMVQFNRPSTSSVSQQGDELSGGKLRSAAQKAGITPGESETSQDSVGSNTRDSRISAAEAGRTTPTGPNTGVFSTIAITPGVIGSQSESDTAVSPNAMDTRSRSTRSKRASKSSALSADRSVSPAPSFSEAGPSRAKKSTRTIPIDEEKLVDQAAAIPVKHRKEPDIIETKTRSVKNAINARVNRQKHKLYVEGLEEEVEDLKKSKPGPRSKEL